MKTIDHDLQDRLAAVRGQYHAQRWSVPNGDEAPLLRSWERCKRAGLDLSDRISFELVSRSQLAEIDDRYGNLVHAARPETQRLGDVLAGTGCVVLLTNHRGVVVDRQGDIEDARELRSISRVGVNLDERCVGTTAPSVVLDIWQPYLVGRDAHFCDNVRKFFCVAAPIESPTGVHMGVLDLTAYDRTPRFNALAMVTDAALAIENSMFAPTDDMLLVRFHPRRELLGTAYECIVGVDAQGAVVAANRAALRQLGLSRPELPLRRFGGLFDRDPGRIVARGMAAPREFELRTGEGLLVHARIQVPSRATAVAAPALRSAAPAPPALPTLETVAVGAPALADRLRSAQRGFGCDAPVLLSGETGTGKEWAARALHAGGPRPDAPFAVLDCAALGEALEFPADSTLFIDELADLPLALQPRLLRLLQQREGRRLGERFRLICATAHDPAQLLAAGRLRDDVYYRLHGMHVALPALRDRDDLAGLVRALFCEEHRRVHGSDPALGADGVPLALAPATWAALLQWRWPGNFRELRHVALSLAAACGGSASVGPDMLPKTMAEPAPTCAEPLPASPATMRDVELQAIEQALERCRGNLSAAARRLGVSRNTIYRRLNGRH
jgi:transcriptional regulator of acetoin/glycerol metabolism